jgi:uncharacterized membrane protein
MLTISRPGRYLFAIALIAFGIIQFLIAGFLSSLFPIPDSLPARKIVLYIVSALFILSGAGIIVFKENKAALTAGLVLLLLLIYPHLFSLLKNLHNGGEWAVFGETAAFCGGAFILAEQVTGRKTDPAGGSRFWSASMKAGPLFFGIALLIFGVQHFLYAKYIATLIPHWIPFPLFWSYFVGVAFIAGAASILLKIRTRLASSLLGFMFLFWVIFVHAPRVMANPHTETEWTSLFVAMGFCGIFFTLAGNSGLVNKSRKENA